VLFVEALSRARELDAYYKAHGKPVGPLHGLPISLKDQFRVSGAETSMGYVSWLGPKETAETESWLVSRLRELGAVFHCKTNVPTSLMVGTIGVTVDKRV
jgi:amidase